MVGEFLLDKSLLKKILQKAAKEKGYADTLFFVDDSDIFEPSQKVLVKQAIFLV